MVNQEPGQLNIFDAIVQEALKNIKSQVKSTEKIDTFTKIENKVTGKIDSDTILEKYRKIGNLARVIQYCGGGYGIEVNSLEGFRTIYVNREGKEEFCKDKRLSVFPMDKILHYKVADIPLNSLQEERLQSLKTKYPMAKIIRRKGDENVILELENKVISVNRRGWILEFNKCKAIYSDDEVVREEEQDLEDIKLKVGDLIETTYNKKIIVAEVYSIYNLGCTLSIVWDKNHTAIPKCGVRRVLKSA